MKKLITLSVFFISSFCAAQKVDNSDTIYLTKDFDFLNHSIEWSIRESDETVLGYIVNENSDTAYFVEGMDSLTAIKKLFRQWDITQKEADKWHNAFDKLQTLIDNLNYPKNVSTYSTPPPYTRFDSSQYYYQKYIYWKKKMDAELERINKFQEPTITKALFRYQDSTLKYETLLNKLKNPKQ